MLAAIRDFLTSLSGPADRHFGEDDQRLALAALLVHAMSVDGKISEPERDKLRDILASQFRLSDEDLEALVADAVAAEGEAVDLYRFTSVLKRHFTQEQCRRVVEDLWEIVFADGVAHEFEENLVWRVAELLAVSREDRLAIKAKVAEKLLG
ncbi:Uncharacterized conserved protein, tellurite resistance protein B (TerB) family [Faunimonas pinastri]|uniref:Uncharacterized conserved protein, tellurite resistance protein B (TerB) family n=2 Tax=Faunimonas pinastri TaxID=1855383 RepID=A0A1H9LZD6_9HYPH|nr:Uncharacterized conserved protein, tellurite resistance protein B (TerB) family [Faunimonas pinastri]